MNPTTCLGCDRPCFAVDTPQGAPIRLEPDPRGPYRINQVGSGDAAVFVADRLGDGRRLDHVKRGTALYRLHLCDFRGDLVGVDWENRYDLVQDGDS